MTSIAGGLVKTVSTLGFGNSASVVSVVGGTIDLTGAPGLPFNQAFSMPRDGTITSLAAHFSNVGALTLLNSTITITAQLYQSTSPDANTFTAIPGTVVTLGPALTGISGIGQTSRGILTGLSIPVTAEIRLLLVYSCTVAGIDIVNPVVGYASAGVGIN